jgi:SAM-dependent methyltransferase
VSYDPGRAAGYYDELGEQEWTRFEDGRTSWTSLEVHAHYLRRFVRAEDRVLDIGAGPGRFTIELARLGATVVVCDISPVQLDLNRQKLEEAGLEEPIEERVLADVLDLSRFADETFDAVVCYGGPLSYVVDEVDRALDELVRVTRTGGHVLASVMSLVGAFWHQLPLVVDLARRDGVKPIGEIARTGFLPDRPDYGHLAMHLFRWSELEPLLARHAEVVAAAAAGLLKIDQPAEPELCDLLVRLELELGAEPGAVDGGEHILAVLRKR